ncbi:hypothetical protein ACFC6L_19405 [Kitasatospora phosalacinea]|uniref:hypothetical protein n=1 Tax=Kitasatospora phosalacinea TaxID=2065 RepID=UPI0035D915A5
MRIDFPADCRRCAEVYAGRVAFAGGLGVETPLRPRTAQEPTGFEALLRFSQEAAEVIGAEYDEEPGGRPYEPYPVPGGLFLRGGDRGGNLCFRGASDPDPQRWPVVVWSADGEGFAAYGTGLAGFLAGCAEGECPEWTDCEPDEDGRPVPLRGPAGA